MTRSEEELRVGTTQRERGRVRLRKYGVRLDKDTVTGKERVAEELREEQIELDHEDTKGGRHERRRRR